MRFESWRRRFLAFQTWFVTQLGEEQERWFLWCPVAMGLGISVYFMLPWEPDLRVSLAVCAMIFGMTWATRQYFIAFVPLCFILWSMIGLVAAEVRSILVATPFLVEELRAVELRGFIERSERRPHGKTRLTVRVVELGDLPPHHLPRRVTVVLPKRCHLESCRPGQAIELRGSFRTPPGAAISGGYDFARNSYFRGIGGTGFSFGFPKIWTDPPEQSIGLSVLSAVGRFRNKVEARLLAVLDGEPGEIASALLVGRRGGISQEASDALRASGLAHLLAISGLHMSIAAGYIFWSVRALLALFFPIAQYFPIKKVAAIVAFLGVSIYLLLSGMSTATWRAYIMVSCSLLAILVGRTALTMRNIALAACLIMAIKPESILQPGFKMSFAAVVGLVAVHERGLTGHGFRFLRFGKDLASPFSKFLLLSVFFFFGIFITTLVASTATAPFVAYHFCRLAPFSIIGNLMAMPIATLLVMPAGMISFFLFLFGLEAISLSLMNFGIKGILWIADFISKWPHADMRVPQIPGVSVAMMTGGGLWMAIWKRPWRFWGIIPIVLSFVPIIWNEGPDLLIGGGGKLLAVRNVETGELDILGAGTARFLASRWLQKDGDNRNPALLRSVLFKCHRTDCRAPLKGGGLVILVLHPDALQAACDEARVVVAPFRAEGACIGPEQVIDQMDLQVRGTHAFWLGRGLIKEEYAAFPPGARPWRP